MHQKVTILRKSKTSDGWGGQIDLPPVEVKCRINDGAKVMKNASAMHSIRDVRGKEIVATGEIFFDKHIDLDLDDQIQYIDELGNKVIYSILSVKVIRGLSGKPMLSVVTVI
jgi:hypothetical protein